MRRKVCIPRTIWECSCSSEREDWHLDHVASVQEIFDAPRLLQRDLISWHIRSRFLRSFDPKFWDHSIQIPAIFESTIECGAKSNLIGIRSPNLLLHYMVLQVWAIPASCDRVAGSTTTARVSRRITICCLSNHLLCRNISICMTVTTGTMSPQCSSKVFDKTLLHRSTTSNAMSRQ